jgi:hypothetical protein
MSHYKESTKTAKDYVDELLAESDEDDDDELSDPELEVFKQKAGINKNNLSPGYDQIKSNSEIKSTTLLQSDDIKIQVPYMNE